MSGSFFFRLTATLARRRSKRGIFFLPLATMPCHLKTNLICLSSRDFPALFPLRERVVPSLPWMLGNGPAPPPRGCEWAERRPAWWCSHVKRFSYFTFLLPFRCHTRGIHQWANFLVRAPGKDRGSENLIKSDLRPALWPKEKMASAGTPLSCRLVLAPCVQHLS